MTLASILPWALIAWLLSSRRETAPASASPAAAPPPATAVQPPAGTVPASYTPEPWPQAVPAGLPAFPGAGWVPDDPPGAGVVARASQLIPVLWARGSGAHTTEQTAGRWITYRATPMGQKKGVVAFRLADETLTTAPSKATPPTAPASTTPATLPASTSTTALRTLRLTSPRTTGADVTTLQKRLAISADGVFGTGTHAAVVAFQKSRGLVPDGIVGPKTWAALFAGSA